MSVAIDCLNCGIKGVLKQRGRQQSEAPGNVFKRLGRNHFSGHLHFQCPVCEMVMLVDPAIMHSRYPFFTGKLTPFSEEAGGLYHNVRHERFMNTPKASPSLAATSCR